MREFLREGVPFMLVIGLWEIGGALFGWTYNAWFGLFLLALGAVILTWPF